MNGISKESRHASEVFVDDRLFLSGCTSATEPNSNAFDDPADEQRLKRVLKRAFAKVDAPQSLIDSIRRNIRSVR